jgi:hypothetical protein
MYYMSSERWCVLDGAVDGVVDFGGDVIDVPAAGLADEIEQIGDGRRVVAPLRPHVEILHRAHRIPLWTCRNPWWSSPHSLRTLSAGCGAGPGRREVRLGAQRRPRRRPGRWLTLVVAIVTLGAYAAVSSQEPHPEARFALVDIDAYPRLTGISACANPLVPKPGVAAFRSMILSQVGGTDDGLAVCKEIANGTGTLSDHADGRAWDWHAVAARPADAARVAQVLDWLLRTDERGQRNAMARRIGITYIIWNHLYYRVGSDGARWVPYTGTADPHDTHVHFSFSVAGAAQQTSWWTERGPLTWQVSDGSRFALGDGPVLPLAGDWNGDGHDTVGAYNVASRQFTLWQANWAGAPATTTPPIGPFGAIPFVGDWDGDGHDDVGVYEPLARRFSFFFTSGAEARPAQVFGSDGDLPIIGDWNGDGIDDIGTYTPSSRTFTLLPPDGLTTTRVFGTAEDTPIAGDWNGDGVDEIGVFRSSTNTFYFAHQPTVTSITYPPYRQLPVVGDWNGAGADSGGVVRRLG